MKRDTLVRMFLVGLFAFMLAGAATSGVSAKDNGEAKPKPTLTDQLAVLCSAALENGIAKSMTISGNGKTGYTVTCTMSNDTKISCTDKKCTTKAPHQAARPTDLSEFQTQVAIR